MKTPIYNAQGAEVGSIDLPDTVFGAKRNSAVLHQVVTAMMANARTTIAHTKGRAEVRGGGKKPWAQKGTGRARHGSIRSPIWRGGGIAHGPNKERVFEQKVNKKMRAVALKTALSDKVRESRLMLLDTLQMKAPKTKDARSLLTALGKAPGFSEVATRRKNAVLIAVPERSDAVAKSFRNMKQVMVEEIRNINPVEILKYRYLLIASPEESVKTLTARVTK
ncbi:50S ribosomal protein L4 [Patescibacteria group bacterium]|nr:50S ribosomal protein L4 [Patescibacteria group bacterium]